MCSSIIPRSYYEAKRKLRDLGLGYETIHACKYECLLYWKEFADLQHCPTYGEARYKVNHNRGKKISHKVLRHFPLVPRLQHLFVSQEGSADMRWHREKHVETDDVLRHPAEAERWKHFDSEYPIFASDPRNMRLGLASNGFNPFGQMSMLYNMWPVMLLPYNFPPWKCMKETNFFMSLLIPGPRPPGREIDVYLQPLIEELKELWTFGVRTYDSLTGQFFQLSVVLLWTINDFSPYGDLSGWSKKGYQICPICIGDRSSFGIRGRISFMGHRRYLLENHVWRRFRLHDGKVEHRASSVDKKRKRALNWTKRSIFFELLYWSRLLLHHKLDVMHIEKNVCDNLVVSLNIEGKTKDITNARLDLQDLKIRKDLHLVEVGSRLVKPHASYTLTSSERVEFCNFLKSVKKHLRLQRRHAQNAMNLYKRHERIFPEWFRAQVLELHESANLSDDFFLLAMGPSFDVHCYNGCIVGGLRFHTVELDSQCTTQNSGVMVIGESDASGSGDNNFYGVLDEVQFESCASIQNKRIWDVPEVNDVENEHINILEVVVSHQVDDHIEDDSLYRINIDPMIVERPVVQHVSDDFIDDVDEHLSHASNDNEL
ncbi:uncharacterized protein E5676_scaffold49G00750 [Cucumis melo var. makuwa]|uniref:DUF4218 domain-containing protein n=1 Tax=Cucumis melo var. makuwa TaxID=1194695 RepID=A0A5D3BQ32_CUCMM|nr:uncharacterized protein E5676_scaffold49G00750 [Cucumis melo var. makuwa]